MQLHFTKQWKTWHEAKVNEQQAIGEYKHNWCNFDMKTKQQNSIDVTYIKMH